MKDGQDKKSVPGILAVMVVWLFVPGAVAVTNLVHLQMSTQANSSLGLLNVLVLVACALSGSVFAVRYLYVSADYDDLQAKYKDAESLVTSAARRLLDALEKIGTEHVDPIKFNEAYSALERTVESESDPLKALEIVYPEVCDRIHDLLVQAVADEVTINKIKHRNKELEEELERRKGTVETMEAIRFRYQYLIGGQLDLIMSLSTVRAGRRTSPDDEILDNVWARNARIALAKALLIDLLYWKKFSAQVGDEPVEPLVTLDLLSGGGLKSEHVVEALDQLLESGHLLQDEYGSLPTELLRWAKVKNSTPDPDTSEPMEP